MRVPEFVRVTINRWGYEKTLKIGCLALGTMTAALFMGEIIFKDNPSEVIKMLEEEN